MKGRQSGMPDETSWDAFFDAEAALSTFLGMAAAAGNWVEFGCGYGTFSVPAARRLNGVLTAFDIEPAMVDRVRGKALSLGLSNVDAQLRDVIADGTGLPARSQDHAMLFNLLHVERPAALLNEAHRILRPDGIVSVMHWRSDILTPRGPSLAIRPTPDQCRAWLLASGFSRIGNVDLRHSCPYHYGLIAARPSMT